MSLALFISPNQISSTMDWIKLLASQRVKELAGKKHISAKPDSDTRTQLERDYGRAVFCTPVRRLQDKAQVFPRETHDFVRTRLTHSMEVSALARSLAGALREILSKEHGVSEDHCRSIEVVAATAGLLHDIGNPPFGHAGEQAIQEWYKSMSTEDDQIKAMVSDRTQSRHLDFRYFDGNPQTLRLVTKLQVMADHFGLNLCAATVASLMKYSASSSETHAAVEAARENETTVPHAVSKPGYFDSESDVVGLVRNATGIGTSRHPIALIVEAADDICYSSV